jgi:hypothetical protein
VQLTPTQANIIGPLRDAFAKADFDLSYAIALILVGKDIDPETWTGGVTIEEDGTLSLVMKEPDDRQEES